MRIAKKDPDSKFLLIPRKVCVATLDNYQHEFRWMWWKRVNVSIRHGNRGRFVSYFAKDCQAK